MSNGNKTFTIDRTPDGSIKINPVSVGNLIALLALVGVAIGSYSSLQSGIAILNERISVAQSDRLRVEESIARAKQRSDILAERLANIQQRLTVIEVTTNRLDRKLDALVK